MANYRDQQVERFDLETVDKTNAFLAKLLGYMSYSLNTDEVQSKDAIVCAANDESFALAA